ncbi:hypothetical protein HYV82_01115 [Candidatus Woesearchaeota archaeon]|nr:hypothetical protein [Candidatus Woesearchaeota archaeon]
MDKRLVFVLLVVLMVAFAGCTGQVGIKDSKSGVEKFRTGTKGLVLSFVPGTPPARFLGEGKFTVAVQLKNAGATTIDGSTFGGNVYLSGFDPNIITGMKTSDGIGALGGRGTFDPEGEFEIKEFPGDVALKPGIDTYKPTIQVTSCYSYETLAVALVCIDSDPFGVTSKQKVCSTKDVSLSGGQGAPVAVTKIELNPTTDKLRFVISVSNAGGGTVYEQGSQNCNPYSAGLSFKEIDEISLQEVRVADRDITSTCKPLTSGRIKLISGKRSVFCELDMAGFKNTPAFNTPLSVKLRYGYRDSISKTVEIVRAPS